MRSKRLKESGHDQAQPDTSDKREEKQRDPKAAGGKSKKRP